MTLFDLEKIVRPNIKSLQPYRCARDDYKHGILLDANENTHGPSLAEISQIEATQELNRYPDPHQLKIKQLLSNLRNDLSGFCNGSIVQPITPDNICLGVGSDESIDALMRVFCVPGKDKLLTCPPTYGMYSVCAQVNDVQVMKVNLKFNKGNFQIDTDTVSKVLTQDPSIKLVYLTTPGNPTATLLDPRDIEKLLNHPTWNGIVIIDEAYIDFAPKGSTLAPLVTKYPNLAVLQTLSKAFGLAGARLGITFANPKVIQFLNSIRYPYNISTCTSQIVERALSPAGISVMHQNVAKIVSERSRLISNIKKFDRVGDFLSADHANFLLVEILNKSSKKPCSETAFKIYKYLAEKKQVVVRFRGSEPGCDGALRITVGRKQENNVLLKEIENAFKLY